MRWRMIRFVSWVLLVVLVAGCSAEATVDSADGFSIEAALGDLPLSALGDGTSADIVIVDLDAAAEQAGIPRPSPGSTDADELIAFLGALTGFQADGEPGAIFAPLPQLLRSQSAVTNAESLVDEFGFSAADVTWVASVAALPSQFTVLEGVSLKPDLPQIADGVGTIGQGEDLQMNPDERTPVRSLGRPHRVAERDGQVAISLDTNPIIDWVGGSQSGTLADDPVVVGLARRLDENRVVSAFLARRSIDDRIDPTAIGWAVDEQGPFAVVVVHYGNDETANQNLEPLRASFDATLFDSSQTVADLVTLESIEARGAEVVARVRFSGDRGAEVIFDLLIRGEGPFAS